jgi:hypothetical protein
MDYNHLPDCKHPHAPIDVCGCEVKILKAKVAELEDKYRRRVSKVVALLAEKNLQHDVLIDNEVLIESLQDKNKELENVKERLSIDIMVLEKQLKDALHLLFKSEDA